jgi:hypothetical protein
MALSRDAQGGNTALYDSGDWLSLRHGRLPIASNPEFIWSSFAAPELASPDRAADPPQSRLVESGS